MNRREFDDLRLDQIFGAVQEPMEQLPSEIRPFVAWLLARKPHNAVEIGVRNGGTAALWHHICSGIVIGVDWTGRDSLGDRTLDLAREMEFRYPRYRFVLGDSHESETFQRVHNALNGASIDFLFIDGDHSYDGVKKDFDMYSRFVSQKGCIAFHDIVDTSLIRNANHGVYKLWREFAPPKLSFCVNAEWGGIGVVFRA